MSLWLTGLAAEPAQLLPARLQMAFTLMFHIVLVPFGVAFPTIMLTAHYRGLRRSDPVALRLARRWSHAVGLTFAVGAVSGTVLSFEMGLLWPGLTGTYGDVFGLPFAIEGIAFFIEAILIAIYIYGWRRLRPWRHFWLGMPIPVISLVGAFSIISANAWMNTPKGFTVGSDGRPTDIDPIDAIFNPALPYEFAHFVPAAYMAAGFTVASIYVVGWLRGRRDRYHRLGILIPFTVAAVATPLQLVAGDTIARWLANNQPTKFARAALGEQQRRRQRQHADLPVTQTEFRLVFRRPPRLGLQLPGHRRPDPDQLVVRLDPSTGARIELDARRGDSPGPQRVSLDMELARSGGEGATPYEVLLQAAMQGNPTRFTRQDGVEETWRILQPLLDAPPPVQPYAPGSWGPAAADTLPAGHGRWHEPWVPS